MLERYLISDSEEYVDVDCVREALGIKEDENIFRAIEKLREDRDNLKDNLRITENALKTVKKERDELKEKCDKLKKRANAAYGVSCGYSGDKAPAFLCDVISYSWSFDAIGTPLRSNSIRVELSLTPTANYKGTFDLEDLKKYIQNYGREKKLGIIESVDYQYAKAARAELAWLYKELLGVDRLDPDLSPHEIATRIKRCFNIIKDREQKIKMASDIHAEDAKKYYRRTVELKRELETVREDLIEWIKGLRSVYAHVKGHEPPLEATPSATASVCRYEIDAMKTKMRDLEQKLNDIKDICDGNSDVMNIIG